MCGSRASVWQGMERDYRKPNFSIQHPVCLCWWSPPDQQMGTFILSSIFSHRNLLPWMLSGINIRCWPQCNTGTWCPYNIWLQKPRFLWRQLPPHPTIQQAPSSVFSLLLMDWMATNFLIYFHTWTAEGRQSFTVKRLIRCSMYMLTFGGFNQKAPINLSELDFTTVYVLQNTMRRPYSLLTLIWIANSSSLLSPFQMASMQNLFLTVFHLDLPWHLMNHGKRRGMLEGIQKRLDEALYFYITVLSQKLNHTLHASSIILMST